MSVAESLEYYTVTFIVTKWLLVRPEVGYRVRARDRARARVRVGLGSG